MIVKRNSDRLAQSTEQRRLQLLVQSILSKFTQCFGVPLLGAGIACWLERRIRDRKVVSSNPGRSGGRIFFSRVNFVCRLLFGVRSTPVLPQWHVQDPLILRKAQVAGYT